MSAREASRDGAALVREAARAHAPDQYLCALLAPAEIRDDLVALAAFTGEVQRVGREVREPQIGEIRLVWWRDAVTAPEGACSGSPVADAFAGVVQRRRLSHAIIDVMIAAEARALYLQPPESAEVLAGEVDARDGGPMRLAAALIGTGIDDAVLEAAARAYGFARVARDLPLAIAAGRMPLPVRNQFIEPDWAEETAYLIGEARKELAILRGMGRLNRRERLAILPAALVEPYLRALQRPDHRAERDVAELAPLTRVFRLARAWATGRF